MKKNLLFVLTLISFSPSLIFALQPFDAKNIYIDGNLGFDFDENFIAGGTDVGYQFEKNWGVELGYTRTEFTDIVDLALKGILPLNAKNELFGKIGPAYNNLNMLGYHSQGAALFLAGGITHHLNSHFSIGAQALGTTANTSAISNKVLALGTLSYHF